MTSLFVELPWSRKVLAEDRPDRSAFSAEAANDSCQASQPDSSKTLFRFRREDGLPHAL
jgi:hypothetical protein